MICEGCFIWFSEESGIVDYYDVLPIALDLGNNAGDHKCDRVDNPEITCDCVGHGVSEVSDLGLSIMQALYENESIVSCACCNAPGSVAESGFNCACSHGYCVAIGNVCQEWIYAALQESSSLRFKIVTNMTTWNAK
jgi:hypothetical protein